MEAATYDPTNPGWWYQGDPGVESNWWQAAAPTPDPANPGWAFTGDPSQEWNWWQYSPPGQMADQAHWNFEPDSGSWNIYPPGEQAPPETTTFDWPQRTPPGGPPSGQNLTDAMTNWMNENGLGEPLAGLNAPGAPGAPPEVTNPSAPRWNAETGKFEGGTRATGPGPAPGAGGGGPIPPGATNAKGEILVVGLGMVDPNTQVYLPGHGKMTAMEAADIQHQETVEANQSKNRLDEEARQRGLEDRQRKYELDLRAAKLAEDNARRLHEDALAKMQTDKSIAAQNNAQRAAEALQNATLAREKLQAEQVMHGQSLAAQQSGQASSQKLALAQALLAHSMGPGGDAFRKVALELLRQMGINTEGMESTGLEGLGGTGGGSRIRFAAPVGA